MRGKKIIPCSKKNFESEITLLAMLRIVAVILMLKMKQIISVELVVTKDYYARMKNIVTDKQWA